MLYEEWFSPCEFPIQLAVLVILCAGLPVTLLVESVRVNSSFRASFLTELFASVISLTLLFLGTRTGLKNLNSSCALTSPRLWNIFLLSMGFTWTCILVGTIVMVLSTVAVLVLPTRKHDAASPVLPHKFRTYYGTL